MLGVVHLFKRFPLLLVLFRGFDTVRSPGADNRLKSCRAAGLIGNQTLLTFLISPMAVSVPLLLALGALLARAQAPPPTATASPGIISVQGGTFVDANCKAYAFAGASELSLPLQIAIVMHFPAEKLSLVMGWSSLQMSGACLRMKRAWLEVLARSQIYSARRKPRASILYASSQMV